MINDAFGKQKKNHHGVNHGGKVTTRAPQKLLQVIRYRRCWPCRYPGEFSTRFAGLADGSAAR